MAESELIVYATNWCGDCARARRFLDEHHVAYRWIDIDRDRDAEAPVVKVNRGNRSVPTLIFPDGSVLVEPSNTELAQRLGIEA
jgi:glutaredoxin-like protein